MGPWYHTVAASEEITIDQLMNFLQGQSHHIVRGFVRTPLDKNILFIHG